MAEYTSNYNLYKPNRLDDGVQVDTTLTDNFVTVDTEIKNRKNEIDANTIEIAANKVAAELQMTTHQLSTVAHDSQNLTHGETSVKSSLDDLEGRLSGVEPQLVITTNTANSAGKKVDTVQEQVNLLVVSGDSSVEAAQARVNADALVFDTVKDRLDDSDSRMADNAKKTDGIKSVTDFSHLKIAVANGFDWSAAIQATVNSMTKGTVLLPNEDIVMTAQINLKSDVTIATLPNTKIVNGITAGLGTSNALFYAIGSVSQIGTITAEFTKGANTVSVSTASGLVVGDVICFTGDFLGRNISIIEAINGTTITLDRQATNTIANGSAFHKMTPVTNVHVSDLNVDFNGKYGYGVFIRYGRNCRVENIHSKNIGSKVVELSGCVDSYIGYVTNYKGFSNSDGGHSYIVRLAVCNDCEVENVFGQSVRHVVDLSGSSRNTIRDCSGYYNASSDFLTHANGCKDNLFIDNKSVSNQTSAYSFSPFANVYGTGGDTGNIVQGGYIEGSPILYWDQDGSNIIKGVTVRNNKASGITFNGNYTFEECHFILDVSLVSAQTASTVIDFIGCTFDVNVIRGIASVSTLTVPIKLRFTGGKIKSSVTGGVIAEGGTATTIELLGVTGDFADNASDFPPFLTKGTIYANNSHFEFPTSGLSFFGLSTGTILRIDNNTFKNATKVWRTYTSNDCSVKFGRNKMINSTYAGLANLINVETFGLVDIGLTVKPTTTNFVSGKASFVNGSPTASGYIGWVYTSAGAWKGFGLIEA